MIVVDTKFGEVKISTAMFDLDGTTLQEGIEIRIDNELVLELFDYTESDFNVMIIEEIENLLIQNNLV